MSTYTKLFQRILVSSIWDEDDKTRLVWITMLAMTDRDGVVTGTVNALARNARVDRQAVEAALVKFLAPDPETLTADNQGRRVEVVEGGWKLLNHSKYREMMSLEDRREYYRKKRAEYRKKEREANRGLTAREIVNHNVENGI